MEVQLIIELIVSLIILAAVIYYVYKKKSDADKANQYLEKCIGNIRNVMLTEAANAILEIKNKKFSSVEEFEKYVLEKSTENLWAMVEEYLDKAVQEKTISPSMRNFINREHLVYIINTAITKLNISSEIRAIYCENIIKSSTDEMILEDNKLADKFNSDDYIDDEDEADEINKTAVDDSEEYNEKKLIGDNEYEDIEDKEIVPAKDEVDITQDDSVIEEIGEDGLTDSEREAGYRFNKAGRKVDSKGRFVKLK